MVTKINCNLEDKNGPWCFIIHYGEHDLVYNTVSTIIHWDTAESNEVENVC